jgi:hypothetical protein
LKKSKKARETEGSRDAGAGRGPVAAGAAPSGEPPDGDEGRPQGRRFWSTSFYVLVVVTGVANVAHILFDRHRHLTAGVPEASSPWLAATLALVGVAAAAGVWLAATRWRRTVQLFASLEFASLTTFAVLLGTAAGTVILQRQTEERVVEYYGEGLAEVFQGLHLFDLFDSWWFMGLLGLVGVSLTVDAGLRIRDIVRKKKDAWRRGGFVLTHGGIVVVLVGGLVSHLGNDKGMIDLTKGMVSERYVRYEAKPGEERIGQLGFGIRLDDFELEYHDPAWSVYLFRATGGQDRKGHAEYETVAALDPTKKETRTFGDGYRLSVAEFDRPASAQAGGTPHELVIDGERRVPVQPGDVVDVGGGVTLKVERYLPHFNFDIQRKRAVSVSDRPENPALELTVQRPGAEPALTWLFAKNPGFSMGGHAGGGDGEGDVGKRVVYRLSQPEVVLKLSQRGQELTGPQGARLPLGASTALFPQGEWFVAFQEKGDRIKQYHSTISILDGGQVVVDRAPLSVNHPVSYGGFAFYQSNFRAWDLDYSGIQVVKDPGLVVVYVGMILMMLGVLYVLYARKRPGRETADAPGGEAAPAPRAAAGQGS